MGYAVYYQDEGKWTWSDKPPWDSRPTVDNIWAAFTAAEWATQQRLDWSHRERVRGMSAASRLAGNFSLMDAGEVMDRVRWRKVRASTLDTSTTTC